MYYSSEHTFKSKKYTFIESLKVFRINSQHFNFWETLLLRAQCSNITIQMHEMQVESNKLEFTCHKICVFYIALFA